MHPALLPLLTFLGIAFGLLSVYSLCSDLFLRDRAHLNRRLGDEFRKKQHDRARKKSSLFKDLNKLASEAPDDPGEVRATAYERIETMIEQSGLELGVRQLAAASAAAAVLLGMIGILLQGNLLVGTSMGVLGAAAPLLFVHWKRRQRLEALRPQLPEAFDLMARGLRAGQTLPQAMQTVADESTAPISEEFMFCYEQQNLGLSTEAALRDLARRTGLLELNIFVVAMVVQREVGGNVAEMLEELARLIRERFRVRGTIRVLTAEGRMQAAVLIALPPLMFAAMFFLNRSYATILVDNSYLLAAVVASMSIGALWIRQIVNFDF